MFHLGFLEGLPKYDKKENNMEWKELEIDNLPPDILTGNYEFQMWSRDAKCDLPNTYYDYKNYSSVVNILEKLNMGYYSFRYRKPEPKQPSHKEIWNRAWRRDNGVWFKVSSYDPSDKTYLTSFVDMNLWKGVDYFIGRKSADIPPES